MITRKLTLRDRKNLFGYLLLIPAFLMMILFIGYPIVYSFLLTFSDFSLTKVDWFAAGTSHYARVLTDTAFVKAFWVTVTYTAIFVPLSVSLALIVGVLIQQVKIGATFFRSVLFLPSVVPLALGYLMFQWVLDPSNGILNHILADIFGMPQLARAWLNSKETVVSTIVAVTLWGFGPWILMLSGLLAIPKDFYEAARVDGATSWEEFRYITLPLMRVTIMIVAVLQVIFAMKIFGPIYIMTLGGPAGASRSLYYLVWERINRGPNWYSYASTVGWVFTLIVITFSLGTSYLLRSRD
jgi:ABC-type sugar transport system permease subunit